MSDVNELSGRRFGHLLVGVSVGTNKHRQKMWHCECDCGESNCVSTNRLLMGTATLCSRTCPFGLKNLTNRRFGHLIVLGVMPRESWRRDEVEWLCKCECGKTASFVYGGLLKGTSTACSRSCKFSGARKYALPKPIADLYNVHRAGALVRGFRPLNPAAFERVVVKPCAFCNERSTGIDRIDSRKGYTPTNLQPACFTCNFMKRASSDSAFLAHVGKIFNHRIDRAA